MKRAMIQVMAVLLGLSILLVPQSDAQTTHPRPDALPGDVTIGSAPAASEPALASTHNPDTLFGVIENGKTTIALRVCSAGPHFQLRSESVGQWMTEVFYRTQAEGGCSPSPTSWRRMVYNIDAGGGETFRIYVTAYESRLDEATFMQRARRYRCTVPSPGQVTCDRETVTAPHIQIDEPAAGQPVSGSMTVRGWAVDRASGNGPGVSDVHVRVNGTLIGAATYGDQRTDVGSYLGDSRFTPSGYHLTVDTRTVANGTATLQIAARSRLTGKWHTQERHITIDNPTVPPDATHRETRLRGKAEYGQTTILLQICGTGQNYRFRSTRSDSSILWDRTYGTIDGCTHEYRAVINASVGSSFHFYSTVMDGTLSDADFLAQAKQHTCIVDAVGQIRCQVGTEPPEPGNRLPGGGTTVNQGHGFDTCAAPDLSTMGRWVQASPYRTIGIYIGGSSRACAQRNLNSTWIHQTAEQGWHFIPIWVGPQAACSGFRSRHSMDPATAYNQGKHEARQAVAAAQNLGLTDADGTGTIIYYDMENFDTTNGACRTAVRSFLSGWVAEIHAQQNQAGIYGSACASAASDWAGMDHPPDSAWLAAWHRYRYDPSVSVFGVPCVADSLWANHQRIRQYTGGHTETWGGIPINIDANRLDGIVVTIPNQALVTGIPETRGAATSATVIDQADPAVGQIERMHLVADNQGWIIRDQHVLWTQDGGHTWTDITPTTDATLTVYNAAFMDPRQGYLVGAVISGEHLRLTIWTTQDGGGSWQTTTVSELHLREDMLPRSATLDVIDAQHAWTAITLATSANFSQGILFATQDGGTTWTQHALPMGGTIHFRDGSTGWLVGGPLHGQVAITHDGGHTWESQEIVPQTATDELPVYGRPTLLSSMEGLFPVAYTGAAEPRVELYRTQDGGTTWELAETVAMDQAAAPGTPVALDIIDATTWAITRSDTAISLPESTVETTFITPDHGWARTVTGTCHPATDDSAAVVQSCHLETALLQTRDAGTTWTAIHPETTSMVYLPLVVR